MCLQGFRVKFSSSTTYKATWWDVSDNWWHEFQHIEVCGCYSVTFLNWAPIFDWCVFKWKSKNKHHDKVDVCQQENKLHFQVLSNHTTLNSEQNQEDLRIYLKIFNKHALPITTTKSRKVWFSVWLLLMFHRRFANTTQLQKHNSDQQKMGRNTENELNNTHTHLYRPRRYDWSQNLIQCMTSSCCAKESISKNVVEIDRVAQKRRVNFYPVYAIIVLCKRINF